MNTLENLQRQLDNKFADVINAHHLLNEELTIEIPAEKLLHVCKILSEDEDLKFECLMDVCGVDYLTYGVDDWQTTTATGTGFDRGVESKSQEPKSTWKKPRFAVAYHLLSITHNRRLRVRTFATGEPPIVDSVINIWQAANWFEREVFDLFGIFFKGHPDLRRILTDYGFVGHPLRKDFPTSGHVEVRYDNAEGRVVNQPISIEPRTLVPRVIRHDSRYLDNKKLEVLQDV